MENHGHGPLCECEHVDHFEVETVLRGAGPDKRTVQLPTKHRYGHAAGTVQLETTFGSFHVCRTCADTCLHGIAQEI